MSLHTVLTVFFLIFQDDDVREFPDAGVGGQIYKDFVL